MKPILANVNTFLASNDNPTAAKVEDVRRSNGYVIHTFADLVQKVAALAFNNPEYVLLYRGQNRDHRSHGDKTLFDTGKSVLFAKMYRDKPTEDTSIYLRNLRERYELLEQCEKRMIGISRNEPFAERIQRSKYLRWAILQHYEICPTPLLDVTHSLHVAASFAFDKLPDDAEEGYLFVLGLPQISGAFTVVSHDSMQIIRLNSVCPPTLLRPHFQEGYLIGTFPTLDTMYEKSQYERSEVDAAQRLIAKFRLRRTGFWGCEFHPLGAEALYPEENSEFTKKLLRINNAPKALRKPGGKRA